MNTNHEFCRARADEARRDADAAILDNVRDRHLRAADAWQVMAERGERSLRRRVETEARAANGLEDPAPLTASEMEPDEDEDQNV